METAEEFIGNYSQFKIDCLQGRLIKYDNLQEALVELKKVYEIVEIGKSFLNIPIQAIKVGSGSKKILAWSQMHGNETTTTKGLLDFLNFLNKNREIDVVKEIFRQCTLLIIPMLNPDGAARYTRENVNKVDLNRDALNLHEPESKVLRKCFEDFKPHFCFNLHDQRTIFGAGERKFPATISFLAPSMDAKRTVTKERKKAMQIISAMNMELQKIIPGQIGRFDDSFNINCTGDFFQAQKVPTILVECGHFPQDYLREETRKFFAFSFFIGLRSIATGRYDQENLEDYLQIPGNEKSFRDIMLRDVVINDETVDVAIQYSEKIKAGEVSFEPRVESIGKHLNFFGHEERNCSGKEVKKIDGTDLIENDIVEVILLNKEKLSIKSPDIP
ncbi:M14 family metallopeptidase [Salinimicrobium terrae]|uniref:M14 family metallopeptidase n=1 Tax=Salinimicrobium terrae TaxID=470866 RepID=UPI00041FCFC9|nr:M14 metallopeptidase family protein [Salinimicrobium terrae]